MWDPRAVIVMIIASALSVTLIGSIIVMAFRGMPLGEVGGDVLIAILGAMVAIIAGYVGRHVDLKKDQPPSEDEVDKDGET